MAEAVAPAAAPSVQAFFLPARPGQRLCVLHSPPVGVAARGCVLYVPPFAEEMNRARRMATVQAQAFARAGFAVLVVDLYGSGDSSGDFEQARWDIWLDDLAVALRWLADHHPAPLWLWGLRAGALLAAQAAARWDGAPPNLLLWQPTVSGRAYLRQFLRLKFAAGLARGAAAPTTDQVAASLAAGESVEVAGYLLSPPLAEGLDEAALEPLRPAGRVACFEVNGAPEAALSPALSSLLGRWAEAGVRTSGEVVPGGPFWQSIEVETCPALAAASLACLTADGTVTGSPA